MKQTIAVLLSFVLVFTLAACGRKSVETNEAQKQNTPREPIIRKATTSAQEESTTSADDEEGENYQFDAKTGTLTVSGAEAFSIPWNYDVSSVKHIVISDDVLSADLDSGDKEYKQLETITCDKNCEVSVSASAISASPFYRNADSWTNGVLYIGSAVAAINKDAPTVCRLKSNITKIGWDVKEDIQKTAPQIERFEIANVSKKFQADESGVLYSKSDNGWLTIELFPPAFSSETYDVPDAVLSLDIPAAKSLKNIHISAESSLAEYSVQVSVPPVLSFRVDPGHPSLYSEDGVLFHKETESGSGVILAAYPGQKADKEYRIPDGTTGTAYGAFHNCSNLETLYVPASMTQFEWGEGFFSAFDGCTKLTHVYVDRGNERFSSTQDGLLLARYEGRDENDNVTTSATMYYLPARTEKHVVIPSGVTGFEAYGNAHLETVELGKDVESFMVDACPALQSFRAENNQNGYYTKDGVLYRDSQHWQDPSIKYKTLIYYPSGKKDKEFTVPDGVTQLYGAIEWSSDSAFHNNPYIEQITLPDSVTFIGIGAFAGCTSLKKVNLPESLKNLGNGAFSGCSALKEITIPASLEALGYYDGNDEYALMGSSITDIYYKGTQEQWNAIVHTTDERPTYLPSGVRVHCADS